MRTRAEVARQALEARCQIGALGETTLAMAVWYGEMNGVNRWEAMPYSAGELLEFFRTSGVG